MHVHSILSAFVNLALHKPAYQSSLFQGLANHGPPELAVDGNKDKNWYHGSCTHTDSELYPWWAVDLQHTYHISRVKIYNRNDVTGMIPYLLILWMYQKKADDRIYSAIFLKKCFV